jgi:flavorubredoxin
MDNPQPRDVQNLAIAADTEVLRSRSWNRLRFEVEYALERGTTANSYVIRGDRTALLDPPGASFTEIFLTALTDAVDLTQVDYIILGHVNPNRVETLKVLLEKMPAVTVVCSNPAAKALEGLLEGNLPPLKVVKGMDDSLDLGQGHQLRFMPVPTPRWPDGLWTYDASTEVLFSDKFFGLHRCDDYVYDIDWQALLEDRRYYFDCLMAPNARQVTTVLERLANLTVQRYAPAHGPIVRYGVQALTTAYQDWSQQQKGQALSVSLIYASAYGNTATLAQTLARGITKAGVAVESINAEYVEPDDIKAAIAKSAGLPDWIPHPWRPCSHPDSNCPGNCSGQCCQVPVGGGIWLLWLEWRSH